MLATRVKNDYSNWKADVGPVYPQQLLLSKDIKLNQVFKDD